MSRYMTYSVDKKALAASDELLATVEIQMRGKIADKALRAVGKVVQQEAKRRAPRGDPKHNPTKDPLHKAIIVKLWKISPESPFITAIVGQKWPEGAHSHLVEGYRRPHRIVISRGPNKGQDTGLRAAAKPFMAPAVDTTGPQQQTAFFNSVKKDIDKIIAKRRRV